MRTRPGGCNAAEFWEEFRAFWSDYLDTETNSSVETEVSGVIRDKGWYVWQESTARNSKAVLLQTDTHTHSHTLTQIHTHTYTHTRP